MKTNEVKNELKQNALWYLKPQLENAESAIKSAKENAKNTENVLFKHSHENNEQLFTFFREKVEENNAKAETNEKIAAIMREAIQKIEAL